jgi:hypothetical protein
MATGDAFDEFADDPELESVFGAAREERRAEEEEYTRAAARQWARHRDLVDVARQLQHRGDTVSVHVGETVFVGVIDAVGRDYVQLRTDGGRVDIPLVRLDREREPLPLLIRVIRRARAGGRRAEPGATTFRARLLEYDGDDIDAVIGAVVAPAELRGRIVVGRDHVTVHDHDGGETYLPLGYVAWVSPWRE